MMKSIPQCARACKCADARPPVHAAGGCAQLWRAPCRRKNKKARRGTAQAQSPARQPAGARPRPVRAAIRLSPQAKQRAAGNMPRGAARFCGCLTAQRPAKYRCRAGPLKPPRSALCRPCEAGTPPKRLPHRASPSSNPACRRACTYCSPWAPGDARQEHGVNALFLIPEGPRRACRFPAAEPEPYIHFPATRSAPPAPAPPYCRQPASARRRRRTEKQRSTQKPQQAACASSSVPLFPVFQIQKAAAAARAARPAKAGSTYSRAGVPATNSFAGASA